MKRLSIGTISALFLAGAISPAVLADVQKTFDAQNGTQSQSISQLPPGTTQTPGQLPPGQTPGQGPGQFPPGQMQPPSPVPGTMQTPSTQWPGMGPGANLSPDLVSPFQLAYMAIGGQLDDAGIGGQHYLRQNVRQGHVRGQDIVEAAINQGYISNELMEDDFYIDSVNQFLRMQERDWRN